MDSIQFIGEIRSSLTDINNCPLQEFEGAPEAVIIVKDEYRQAMSGLKAGATILLFTWLHRGDRSTLVTKPRNDPNARTTGVFATRSPDRPNPIGLHKVEILDISATGEIRVLNLEVLNGTPLIDIKPVLND